MIFAAALRRWWWLVIGLPLVVAVGGVVLTPSAPYTTEFRATVLIPGDTEDTGSAERPELMVLDDLPILVNSDVFAQATLDQLTAAGVSVVVDRDEVKRALSGSRYSRVLTVTVTHADLSAARAIADAAAAAIPDAVNAYLVTPGSEQATVQVIDQPSTPAPASTERWLRIGATTVAALFAALAIVALMATLRQPTVDQVRASASDAK